MPLMATEVIEELAHQVAEFGDGPVEQIDDMEPGWRYPVTDVRFDPERQAFTLITDR